MPPNFCGNCGAPLQPGSAFCVQCGTAVPGSAPTDVTVPTAPPSTPAPLQVPPAPPPPFTPMQPQAPAPGMPGYWPGTPYLPPPKKKRTVLIVVVILIVAFVIIGAVAALVLLAKATAQLVNITKTGVSGNSMYFDVTIHSQGATIGVDKLHVNLRSLQNGVEYDAVQYYNIDTIPAGRTFTWSVDILVDPNNLSAFAYEFVLEVDGTVVDSSTVT